MWLKVIHKTSSEEAVEQFERDGDVPVLEASAEFQYSKLTRKARQELCKLPEFVAYLTTAGAHVEINVNCELETWEISAAIETGFYTLQVIKEEC